MAANVYLRAILLLFASNVISANNSACEDRNKNKCAFTNEKVSVSCPLNKNASLSHEDCSLLDSQECEKWIFKDNGRSSNLAEIKLKAFGVIHKSRNRSVLNVTLSDVKFTKLRYRIRGINNSSLVFCREVTLPHNVNITDLFFDCYWFGFGTSNEDFQMDIQMDLEQARTYLFKMYTYNCQVGDSQLEEWYPFMYIDITDLPRVTARVQQIPSILDRQNYEIKVYDGDSLESSHTLSGTDDSEEELTYSYKFGLFPETGNYKFVVQILNASCDNGCAVSQSPFIIIGNYARKIMIGSVIFFVFILVAVLLVMFIRKKQQERYFDVDNLPKALMLYSPSTPSHIRAVTALAEYLRDNCFVVALLDVLDVSRTKSKDPYIWYNEAFRQADFIMVVSSPPKCCNQGIFKDVDVLALNFVTELMSHRYRPHIFNVTTNYCTEDCIPSETVNFRSYKLIEDLDKMLWYIHNNGRYPKWVDLACTFLGPKLFGGKSEVFTSRGRALLGALKAAENSAQNVCNCKSAANGSENVRSALYKLPEEMQEMEEIDLGNSTKQCDAVNKELIKFFVDIESLNLSGVDDDFVPEPSKREPNFLDFLNL